MNPGCISIYGDPISGNCMKVRFVANRLKIPYRWIEVSVLSAETRKPEFLAINPAGQVPVVVLADGRALAQSNAIMLHLAEGSSIALVAYTRWADEAGFDLNDWPCVHKWVMHIETELGLHART
jgi:hypothetical protein